MKPSEFLESCLGSTPGTISFGRTASAVSLLFCIGWDTAYLSFAMLHMNFAYMHISDVLPPAGALAAQVAFCMAFYGGNKLAAAYSGPRDSGPDAPGDGGVKP